MKKAEAKKFIRKEVTKVLTEAVVEVIRLLAIEGFVDIKPKRRNYAKPKRRK
jgi:phage terminase small subunit